MAMGVMEVTEVQEVLCIKQSKLLIKVDWNKLQPFCCVTKSLKVTQTLHTHNKHIYELSWRTHTHKHTLPN